MNDIKSFLEAMTMPMLLAVFGGLARSARFGVTSWKQFLSAVVLSAFTGVLVSLLMEDLTWSLIGRLLPRYSFSACEDDRIVFRKITLFADNFVKSRYEQLGSVLNLATHIFNAWYFNKDNEYASLASLLLVS